MGQAATRYTGLGWTLYFHGLSGVTIPFPGSRGYSG